MNDALETLRFPVGRFTMPEARSADGIARQIVTLGELPRVIRAAVDGLDASQLDTQYRDGGWTVRQVVHHVADSHLHAYTRCKFALTEETPTIKPYEEAIWATLPDTALEVAPSLAILDGLHARWVALLESLDGAAWERAYYHPESKLHWPIWKVAALYAWHCRHHVAHVTALRERMGW